MISKFVELICSGDVEILYAINSLLLSSSCLPRFLTFSVYPVFKHLLCCYNIHSVNVQTKVSGSCDFYIEQVFNRAVM